MALEFDGAKYVRVNSDLGITGGAITMSCWIKLNTEISADAYYILQQSDSGTKVKYAIRYDYNSGTRKIVFYRTKNYVAENSVSYNIALGTANWHHLVLVYDETNVYGFIDLNKTSTVASSGNGKTNGVDVVMIKAYLNDLGVVFTNALDAMMADVRIYNRALTDNEIAEIYHKRGADRVWQGLVGQWRMDEFSSGTPAPLLLDSMDATTGWTDANGAVSQNTTTYQEGGAALNLTKTSTASKIANMYKTISQKDVTGQIIKIWVYIKDQTALNKIAYIACALGANISNRYWGNITSANLAIGWNSWELHIDDFQSIYGSPSKSNIQYIEATLSTHNDSDTLSSGDLIFDFYRAGDYTPNSIIDLSGNGNHGTPYNSPVYQASPHRLRRGVIVS